MSLWTDIRAKLLSEVRVLADKEIDKLDKLEPDLADLIRTRMNPDDRADQLVDLLKTELTKLVDKVFANSLLSKMLGVKSLLQTEIDGLDKYKDDLAAILRKRLDPDERATQIVDFMKDELHKLVDNHLS